MPLYSPGCRKTDRPKRSPKAKSAGTVPTPSSRWKEVATCLLLLGLLVTMAFTTKPLWMRQPVASKPSSTPSQPIESVGVGTMDERLDEYESQLDSLVARLSRRLPGEDAVRFEQRRWIHGDARFLDEIPLYFEEAGEPLAAEALREVERLRSLWERLEADIGRLGEAD